MEITDEGREKIETYKRAAEIAMRTKSRADFDECHKIWQSMSELEQDVCESEMPYEG